MAWRARCFPDCCPGDVASVSSPRTDRKSHACTASIERDCHCDVVSDRVRIWTPRGTPPAGDGYFHGDSGRRHGRGYDFTRRLTATRYLAAITMAVLLACQSWAQTPDGG